MKSDFLFAAAGAAVGATRRIAKVKGDTSLSLGKKAWQTGRDAFIGGSTAGGAALGVRKAVQAQGRKEAAELSALKGKELSKWMEGSQFHWHERAWNGNFIVGRGTNAAGENAMIQARWVDKHHVNILTRTETERVLQDNVHWSHLPPSMTEPLQQLGY